MLLFLSIYSYNGDEHIHTLLFILKYVRLRVGLDPNSLKWVILPKNDPQRLVLDEVLSNATAYTKKEMISQGLDYNPQMLLPTLRVEKVSTMNTIMKKFK